MIYPDLMLDIETYGQNSNATILAIAAVEFNLKTGDIGETFYTTINAESNKKYGMKSDNSTMEWWDKQSNAAKKHVFGGNQLDVDKALEGFVRFIDYRNKDYKVWGNGSSFDCVITKNAILSVGLSCPWKFYNERDVRTLVELNPNIKKDTIFTGIPHYAPDDCKHQIKYCNLIYKSINVINDSKDPVRFFELSKPKDNNNIIKF